MSENPIFFFIKLEKMMQINDLIQPNQIPIGWVGLVFRVMMVWVGDSQPKDVSLDFFLFFFLKFFNLNSAHAHPWFCLSDCAW